MRIYDQHRKESDDNPTIGLILCSEKSEAVAKYSVLTDSKQLFASKYLHYLPNLCKYLLFRNNYIIKNKMTADRYNSVTIK